MLKLIGLAENDIDQTNKNNKIPTRTDYVGKREIDQPYSFDDLFQLVHVDVANLAFLGKSAAILSMLCNAGLARKKKAGAWSPLAFFYPRQKVSYR